VQLPQAGGASLVLTLLMSATMLLAISCRQQSGPGVLPPAMVEVLTLTATNVPLSTEFIGQLDSPQNVEIRARVEAFVDKMLFTEGTEVKEGDPLFLLDKKPFEQRLAAANGTLAEAKAALNKYNADVARLTPLAKVKAIPQQDLDNAIASVEIGKANVLSAEARVQSAMIDLGYCDVRSPVTGFIGAKQVSIGELVGKGQPTLMATISTLDPMWFYCNVSETKFLKAENETRRTGKHIADLPVTLILADGSVHPSQGKIVFADRAVDIKTGTRRVRVEFSSPEKVLRPGMFGRVKIDLGTRPESILVPERAVVELQGKNFAWLIDADNKATQRAIKVGDIIGGDILVLEGLKAGERVVTEGLQKVREGAVVQPMTAAQMAAAAEAAKQAAAQPAKEGQAKHGKE
jgi:membrane fusion protein, multidrug efflux system